MKKLLLAPIISLGLFSGITDDVSAAETKTTIKIKIFLLS